MILCYPQMETILDFANVEIPTLVIENPTFFSSVYHGALCSDGR